jgi:hypothetical protein
MRMCEPTQAVPGLVLSAPWDNPSELIFVVSLALILLGHHTFVWTAKPGPRRRLAIGIHAAGAVCAFSAMYFVLYVVGPSGQALLAWRDQQVAGLPAACDTSAIQSAYARTDAYLQSLTSTGSLLWMAGVAVTLIAMTTAGLVDPRKIWWLRRLGRRRKSDR